MFKAVGGECINQLGGALHWLASFQAWAPVAFWIRGICGGGKSSTEVVNQMEHGQTL